MTAGCALPHSRMDQFCADQTVERPTMLGFYLAPGQQVGEIFNALVGAATVVLLMLLVERVVGIPASTDSPGWQHRGVLHPDSRGGELA